MPYYLPRQTIRFECSLDETAVKNIALTNPTKKPITYSVKLEGTSDFSIDTDQVMIMPKQTTQFPVKFYARISRSVTGRIIFKARKDGGAMAAPLVFDLNSKVLGRHSAQRVEVSHVKIYEYASVEIQVANPYPNDVEFRIEMEYLEAFQDPGPKFDKIRKGKGSEGKSLIEALKESGSMGSRIPAFFLSQEKIRIRRKNVTKLKLLYAPATFEIHRCNLIFSDENIGEMQYEIIGIPQLPNITDTIKIVTNIDSSSPIELPLSLSNGMIQASYYKLLEISKTTKNEEIKEILMQFINKVKDQEHYTIDLQPSGYINIPPNFTVYGEEPNALRNLGDDDEIDEDYRKEL